ncbi:MAG: esterase-like activity of phytase family protein, partial [Alphaproteobacteria bacterium]
RQIGKLTYLGGLVLASRDHRFGGYSGLLVNKDGTKFLAQSDRAYWFTGTLIEESGHVAGVKSTILAPMLGANGKQLDELRGDSESIAPLDTFPGDGGIGDIFVGFETKDRVDRYEIGREGLFARPHPVGMPPEVKNNVPNKGFEGITLLADGRLLAITERTLDKAGNEKGWIVPLDGTPSSTLTLHRDDPYDLTDLSRLPNGDILTLERRYTRIGGPGMRIRRIRHEMIAPGAVLSGEVIAELGNTSSIDNMEGLANRQTPDGKTLLYVISDDNQSPLQHTVLFEFLLNE